jgi:hypothetical protein
VSGSSAAATITGTAPAQVLSLVLPKGDTGAAGAAGAAGATGSQGVAGQAGSTGPAGPANSLTIGTVSEGTASATITGTAPSQVLNLVLPRGSTGATGAAGATGPQGPAGSAASATTSASELTGGTLADALLSDSARSSAALYLWANFR